ncbi:PAS domain S-box protein [Clostridium sp. YIM B02515]|uniref:histidine kinase n=2 Tax=Clostridium rhizosphaerae TaxID=2803861 RepID=A0ABS1TF76_9CLOT|nr:ATP-binding protein [Clostridium rhizosphaerae]MBL4938034.1 PAS domain S-box protein [Clostridium rhizosphaerae]
MQHKEAILTEVEIIRNRFFTITVSNCENNIVLYIQDTTEEVIKNKRTIEKNKLRLEEERRKFLGISTELKTKCDIIEILRDREKEHLMHLKDVINNITEGLIVVDKKGNFSMCNRAVYNIVGMQIGELLNIYSIGGRYNILNTKDNTNLWKVYKDAFEKFVPIVNLTAKFIDKISGFEKFIEINSNPILNRSKEVMYTIITMKDVTEAKLHEIKAEEQAYFINNVVNTLEVPIAVLNYPDLTYKLINKEQVQIFRNTSGKELNLEDIIGMPVEGVDSDYLSGNIYEIIDVVGKKDKEFTLSPYRIIDKNLNERFYKFKFIPYKDIEGKVSSIHMHGLDITEEVNHNIELEKIAKLKDEFFTVISHELRTPLTIIYSSLQLAYNIYSNEISENLDKTLRRIDQNCSRLLKLINNILDLSKAEAGFLTVNNSWFDIVNTTENIIASVNLYAKSKGIELIFDTNEEEVMVCLDKEKYERILLNLLSNAVKFTPEGKQILVTIEDDMENVALSVKDEGIGIPKDKLNYIFDRFAQVNTSLSRRAEGTGIGLSLVKKLVEYMDGKIEVKSNEGVGSEFYIRFNKISAQSKPQLIPETMGSNINNKIDIEFSDIN